MVDTPLSLLPDLPAPISTDILFGTDDPAGAPSSVKIEIGNLVTAFGLTYDAVNSRIQLADAGTFALPAIALDTDPDTGAYWPAANTWAVSVAGALHTSFAAASLSVLPDADLTATLGKAKIGNLTEDNAYFAHFDLLASGTYALVALGSGSTFLNASTGQTIQQRINNVAIGTVSATGIHNPADSQGFYTGASDDLRMYHDGTNSLVDNATGALVLRTAGNYVALSIAGTGDILAASTSGVKNSFDSQGFYTGVGDDLRMYHDGTDSIIANTTGLMRVTSTNSGLTIPIHPADPANIEDGAIWYDSATDKLMVRANGVSVAVH